MKFDKDRKIDLIMATLIFVATSFLSYAFDLKPLAVFFSTLLLPSLYLCLREKKNLLKILVAVLVFGALFGFIFDFIVTFNQGWIVSGLVFKYRLFDFYPIDDILGFMIMTFAIVVFYEHFLDSYRSQRISPLIYRALVPSLIVWAVVIILYYANPLLLKLPYAYLITGLFAIVIPIRVSIIKPRFIKIGIYFFFVWFVIELICLMTGGWFFPGQYFGTVQVFSVTFPLEEFVFWFMLYAAAIVAYYEYYEDGLR